MSVYLKWTITAKRGTNAHIQVADLNFYDSDNNYIAYPAGTTATADFTTYSGEGPDRLLDNDSSTKLCGQWVNAGVSVIIEMPDASLVKRAVKYAYCTANDEPVRDPVNWTIEISDDGVSYTVVDTKTGATVPTARYTLTEKWDITFPPRTLYLLESGDDYYTISGGVLTNIGSTLNAQLFTDYGLAAIPDWSDYSSLANPSVLCWDSDAAQSMTATTSGVPAPNAVVSQNLSVGDGVQTTTIISDNATLYSVSFDGGSTWWKYSGGSWSQVSTITDGMTKAEVEAITESAWADKHTGSLKFRFTLLDENGYVTSIRVDYAGSSGDSVSWTQLQSTGTKIAEIEINGTSQDVYAPNGGSTYTEGDGIDISAQNAISVDTTFTEAQARANIDSGDTFSTILGKIKKFFSDLKTVAFTGAYADLTGQPTIPTDFVSKANGGTFGGNIVVDRKDGTAGTIGQSILFVGNSKGAGADGNSKGTIALYSNTGKKLDIQPNPNQTADQFIVFPDKTGMVALTSDIPTIPTVYTTITKNAVSCPNGGTQTVIGSITLTKGLWFVQVYGYSPLIPSGNNVIKQATQISVENVGSMSLTYRFILCGIANLANDTTCNITVTNYENSTMTSGTNYNLKAIKLG